MILFLRLNALAVIILLFSGNAHAFNFEPTEREYLAWSERCRALYLSTDIGGKSPFFATMPKHIIKHYRDIGNRQGGPWHYCKSLAVYYRAMGEFDQKTKEELYKEALSEAKYTFRGMPESDPWFAEVGTHVARLLIKLERFDEAIVFLNKVIGLYPGYASAYSGLATAYKGKNQLQEGIKALEGGLSRMPSESAELYYFLGLFYLEDGDRKKAEEYAKKAYGLGYPLRGLKDKLSAK